MEKEWSCFVFHHKSNLFKKIYIYLTLTFLTKDLEIHVTVYLVFFSLKLVFHF